MKVEIKGRGDGADRVYDLIVNGKIQMYGESFTVVDQVKEHLLSSRDYWPSETSEVAQRILANA